MLILCIYNRLCGLGWWNSTDSIRGLEKEPKVHLLVFFLLQSLVYNPQKHAEVCSLISVSLNTFLSLRRTLLRVVVRNKGEKKSGDRLEKLD